MVINGVYRRIEQGERRQQSQVIYLGTASCRLYSRRTMNMINLEKERDSKYDILDDIIKAVTRGGLVEGLSPAVKRLKVFSSGHL